MKDLPDIQPAKTRIGEIEILMNAPDFYSDQRKAGTISAEHSRLCNTVSLYEKCVATQKALEDNRAMCDDADTDEELRELAREEIPQLEADIETLYEKLADLMSDKNAVYTICGTVNVYDGAAIPMILTLDAFRQNEAPRVLYSRFFSGEKTSICIFRLSEKKISKNL